MEWVLIALVVLGLVVAGVVWWSAHRGPRPPGSPDPGSTGATPGAAPATGTSVTTTADPTSLHTPVPPAAVPPVPVPSAPMPMPAPTVSVEPTPAVPEPPGAEPPAPEPVGLVPVDLPSPEEMRHRWAATAAVIAGVGFRPSDCSADGGDWYYHDGGGNWARMYRFADGRALLVGHDHEYSETYYADAATYFDEPETDLLAGAPPWWELAVTQHSQDDGEWIGWIYGWDGRTWQRADYDVPDGFESLALPPVGDVRTIEMIREYAYGDEGSPGDDTREARDLVAAGPQITETELRAVGPNIMEPAIGAHVARGFASPGRH